MSKEVDLTDFQIFDIYGAEKKTLKGMYSSEALAQIFIDEWVPYMECHKCARSDYCKYVQPNPYNSDQMMEIKCGIAVDTITNFVNTSFHLLRKMTPRQIQDYLDGAFYITKFVHESEQIIGMCIKEEILSQWGEYSLASFGHMVKLREKLNLIGHYLRNIPEFHIIKGVLFVEGKSEQAFLAKLRESHSAWFLDQIVEVYGGKGNRKVRRIEMLLDKYTDLGYSIYIQGDADGNYNDIFNRLVKRGTVSKENTFVFKYDFESAVPAELLLVVLKKVGAIKDVSLSEFKKKIYSRDKSVVKLIMHEYGLDIRHMKIEIATSIADLLNRVYRAWWQHEVFMETELGKFLGFIQRIF